MPYRKLTSLTAILPLLAVPALAQETPQALEDADVVSLSEWSYDDLYQNGVSAEDFIYEMDVLGENGEEIGTVEDILIGPDGKVISIIAQVGGLWDIGDTHVSVPFDQVELASEGDAVTVPVTEETVDDYGFWTDDEQTETLTGDAAASETIEGVDDAAIERAWRATELIGDYARLKEGDGYSNYGYVSDLVLRDGQVDAVVVSPSANYGRGYRAYPYYGYGAGWTPGNPNDDMPYGEDEVGEMEPFEYENLGS